MSEKGWLYENLANLVTMTRILTPFILFMTNWTTEEKLVAYLILESTDIFDGIIARLTKTACGIGKFLDPLVDKIMRGSGLVFLLINGLMEYWLAFPMILGEIFISIVAVYAIYLVAKREFKRSRSISPSMLYKELKPEIVKNILISPFGRMKAIAYGLGFVCLLLDIYHPYKITEMMYFSFFLSGFAFGTMAITDYYKKFIKWQAENPKN